MRRIFLITVFSFFFSISYAQKHVLVSTQNITTLIFEEKIESIRTSKSKDFKIDFGGRYLHVHPTKDNPNPCLLNIKSGDSVHSIVIIADVNAPLEQLMYEPPIDTPPASGLTTANNPVSLSQDPFGSEQEYFNFARVDGGVVMTLTNICHVGEETFFKFNFENTSSIPLTLSASFEYVTYLKKFLWFKYNPDLKPASIHLGPGEFTVSPKSSKDIIFSVKTFASGNGINVSFKECEKKGIRSFSLFVPTKTLLEAPRRDR